MRLPIRRTPVTAVIVAMAIVLGILALAAGPADARQRQYTSSGVPYVQTNGRWVPLNTLPVGSGPWYGTSGQPYYVPQNGQVYYGPNGQPYATPQNGQVYYGPNGQPYYAPQNGQVYYGPNGQPYVVPQNGTVYGQQPWYGPQVPGGYSAPRQLPATPTYPGYGDHNPWTGGSTRTFSTPPAPGATRP